MVDVDITGNEQEQGSNGKQYVVESASIADVELGADQQQQQEQQLEQQKPPQQRGTEDESVGTAHTTASKPQKHLSIYALYPTSQKTLILTTASLVALLTPFTDTIYLPALTSVGTTLHASNASVSATVSAYLGAVGLGQIIWGPLADRYGRLLVLFGGLTVYGAFTVACIFAEDINTLIALRTIEGFIVGSTVATVQAVIADVFVEEEMGSAMGTFMVRSFPYSHALKCCSVYCDPFLSCSFLCWWGPLSLP
jgi:hypothetical protein